MSNNLEENIWMAIIVAMLIGAVIFLVFNIQSINECHPKVSNLIESHTVQCYNGSVMRIEDNLVFCDCPE